MKSKRMLALILLAVIVVFVGVAGWIYSANSSEVTKQNNLKHEITVNQKTLADGQAAKTAQEQEATTLASKVAAAKTTLAQMNFPSSAQTVDDDRLLYSLAADTNLQITSLSATPATDTTENNTNYQLTTFTVNVAGLAPQKVFTSTADSASYNLATLDNIVAFTHQVATNASFNTAVIPSVSLTSATPMTDEDIAAMNSNINSQVQAGLTASETQGLTADQIAALVKSKLAAMTPAQVQALIQQAGVMGPTAVITIQVWTRKGA